MPTKKHANPFLPSILAQGAHFADREREVEQILRTYRSPGSRLIVFGERRLGKSSALLRAAEMARKEGTRTAIASFATATDPAEAAKSLLMAVRGQLGKDWRRALESMVGRLQGSVVLRPGPSPSVPPSVHLSLGLREESPEVSLIPEALDAVHQELESRKLHLALAIDEFQRLYEWGGEEAEWSLKAAFETHPRVAYVMAGSQKGLIEAMVTTRGRALWKQTDVLPFGVIDPEEMSAWIHSQSARTGADFSMEGCDRIVELAGGRTRDIVQLAREVWFEAQRVGRVDPPHVEAAFDQSIRVQEALYASQWRGLSSTAQRILRALVEEPDIQITSAEALRRFRLGPKSTVSSTVQRLLETEVLSPRPEGGHRFDDPFLRRWIETRVISDPVV